MFRDVQKQSFVELPHFLEQLFGGSEASNLAHSGRMGEDRNGLLPQQRGQRS